MPSSPTPPPPTHAPVTTSAASDASSQQVHHQPTHHNSSSNSSSEHSKSLSHVTWDEETIAEHDLLRGTRQKIEEPNTPYHYYDHDDADADDASAAKSPVSPARSFSGKESGDAAPIEWDELRSKLQTVKQQDAASDSATQATSAWDNDSDNDEGDSSSSHHVPLAARDAEGKKLVKDPAFAAKRKSHYNEFERVKAWRQAHAADNDDDDEDKAAATDA